MFHVSSLFSPLLLRSRAPGPALAVIGLCSLFVGLRRLPLACAGNHWLLLACVGLHLVWFGNLVVLKDC